jgi:hypothetical protein
MCQSGGSSSIGRSIGTAHRLTSTSTSAAISSTWIAFHPRRCAIDDN